MRPSASKKALSQSDGDNDAIVPLEDKMMSPRFQKAMGAIGVLPEDLRPEEPPEVADPSNLEQKATMVRYELRENRRQRDLEKVEEARRVMIVHEQGGNPYAPGRFRTAQPTNITLGLSRSLPGYNLFKTESKCRAIWAKGLNESNIEHKKEMIARAAVTDLEWQDFQKVHREHEKHLTTRLKKVKEAEQKRNAERVREGERKLAESQRRLQKVAAEWEEEGQRRVDAFDAKCKQSEAKVAAAKEQLFSRSCDRDAYVEQCLARRQANLDVFVGKTLESYHKMEDHMAVINAHKEELEKANVREASNKAELAAKERAKVAAMKMEKSRTIGEKVSTRFENLDTYLKGREKERKDFKKERELAWEKQYGRVKKNVKEMQKDFEERRDRVLERQQKVFEQGEQGLANKKLFAGTRREIEDAYRDSVRTNQERQAAADEYKRMMCCEFWKTRSEQFRDVDRFRNIARTAMQKTKKEEIHINNEMRYVVGDIKSYGYRDSRHNKMLKQHGVPPSLVHAAPPKADDEDGKK